jgi:prepilin-type N-terminal cleavage/methylation domain-containing protein
MRFQFSNANHEFFFRFTAFQPYQEKAMSKNVRRGGFTLPEVLVTITIVAVLAAVVVPAVLNQVSKGDTAALAGDVGALRTAISNFTTDTRHYPRTIGDLITKPASTDLDILGNAYGVAAVAAWKGPYFPTSQSVSGTGSYGLTSFNLTIDNVLDPPAAGNSNFITLNFGGTGLTPANVATIDRLYDAGNGVVPAGTGSGCNSTTGTTGNSAGNIQWTESSSGACTVSALQWRLFSAAQ